MLDIALIREQADLVKKNTKRKGQDDKVPLVDEALEKDTSWRQLKGSLDEMRHERNKLSEEINQAKKDGKDVAPLVQKAKELPGKIKAAEEEVQSLRSRIDEILCTLPNIMEDVVPDGVGEEDNVVLAEHGEKPSFSFDPKSHVEIAENLGIVNFDASRTVAGHGFYYLIGDLAQLDLALQRYAIDAMQEAGFTVVIPPFMTRREILDGMVDLSYFEEIVYKLEGEDLYPIATSEFPLVGIVAKKDVDLRKLPITVCGLSPCFRKELGAHGIDEKGLFRTHQFMKVEQVVVCHPDDSQKWFDTLLGITRKIFVDLGLAVRELEMCAGDLGDLKSRMIDLEVYSPRRNDYFEVGSCSNLTDAQARRLNIRFVNPDGTRGVCHTLNNTAIATSRAMVAIFENFQNEDGSVNIPEVLQKYMGKKVITKADPLV